MATLVCTFTNPIAELYYVKEADGEPYFFVKFDNDSDALVYAEVAVEWPDSNYQKHLRRLQAEGRLEVDYLKERVLVREKPAQSLSQPTESELEQLVWQLSRSGGVLNMSFNEGKRVWRGGKLFTVEKPSLSCENTTKGVILEELNGKCQQKFMEIERKKEIDIAKLQKEREVAIAKAEEEKNTALKQRQVALEEKLAEMKKAAAAAAAKRSVQLEKAKIDGDAIVSTKAREAQLQAATISCRNKALAAELNATIKQTAAETHAADVKADCDAAVTSTVRAISAEEIKSSLSRSRAIESAALAEASSRERTEGEHKTQLLKYNIEWTTEAAKQQIDHCSKAAVEDARRRAELDAAPRRRWWQIL